MHVRGSGTCSTHFRGTRLPLPLTLCMRLHLHAARRRRTRLLWRPWQLWLLLLKLRGSYHRSAPLLLLLLLLGRHGGGCALPLHLPRLLLRASGWLPRAGDLRHAWQARRCRGGLDARPAAPTTTHREISFKMEKNTQNSSCKKNNCKL